LISSGSPAAGVTLRTLPTSDSATTHPIYSNFATDVIPNQQCCLFSSNCASFQARRSTTTCTGYLTLVSALVRSTNEIVTFDGAVFPLFKIGDRTLLTADTTASNVIIQGRIRSLAVNTVSDLSPVGFTDVVVTAKSTSRVEVNALADNTLGLVVDGAVIDLSTQTSFRFNGVTVSLVCVTGQIDVVLDVGVQVRVGVSSNTLSLTVSIPQSFLGKTSGVLGTFDHNAPNDISSTGTVIPSHTPIDIVSNSFEPQFAVPMQNSMFSVPMTVPTTFKPNYNTVPLGQCSSTAQSTISTACAGSTACLLNSAINCDTTQALAHSNQVATTNTATTAKTLPPVVTCVEAIPAITVAQNGASYNFIRNLNAVDPEGLKITWTWTNTVGAVIVPVGATSLQVKLNVINNF